MLWKSMIYDEKYLEDKMQLFNQNKLNTTLLLNKKIYSKKEADDFLNIDENLLHNPFLIDNMDKVVDKIISHINTDKKILIYGDYDIDGILGSYYISQIFNSLNIKNIIYIPPRDIFKLKLNDQVYKIIEKEKITTLMTVDNSLGELSDIKSILNKKIDLIITDHHYNDKEGFLEINPKKSSKYPFKELSGTGVLFKLVQAMYIKLNISSENLYEYMELVAIATIADVMESLDENRFLIKNGLKRMKYTKINGFKLILKNFKIDPEYISINDISYRISPLFNAISKLDNPQKIITFLETSNYKKLRQMLTNMYKYNQERKKIENKIFENIVRKFKTRSVNKLKYIYYEMKDLNQSILGSLSYKLLVEFKIPVIIVSRMGNYCKASLRSINNLNIYDLLEKYKKYFVNFGGHKLAAGFLITYDNLSKIRYNLKQDLYNAKYELEDKREIIIDAKLNISELNKEKIENINKFGPFGLGNNEFVFYDDKIEIQNISIFGIHNSHFKAIAIKDGNRFLASGYNLSYKLNLKKKDKFYKIVYTPEMYEYGKIKLKIKDME